MPYPALKSENYQNLGGINRKLSTYLTGPQEFLNLENIDFRTTGSLSSFAGYTLTIQMAPNLLSQVTGIADFYTVNASLGFGGISYFQVVTGQSNAYLVQGNSATFNIFPFIYPNNTHMFSFVESNILYGANQSDFFRYPGATISQAINYSLPKPRHVAGTTGTVFSGFGTGGLTGYLTMFWAFNRYDGLQGPIVAATYNILQTSTSYSGLVVDVPALNYFINPPGPSGGVSLGSFGISSLTAWYSLNGSEPASYASMIPIASTSFAISDSFTGFSTRGDFDDYFGTFLYGFQSDNGGAPIGSFTVLSGALNPGALAVFANALFASAFLSEPDTVWYSRPGEFEKHDIDGFFDFRANDGDIVTNIVSYFTQLIIFKVNSIGALSGTDATTFTLSEVTDQYGTLSNKSACVWNQRLWFLDKKGICEYNGANTRIVSDRIEYIFQRLNIATARNSAIMLHVKERNEVWCAIPIDNDTHNTTIVIYDYLADAWAIRPITSPFNLTYLANTNSGFTKSITQFGDQIGRVYSFGNSLLSDNGTNMTSKIQTRFNSGLGNSVEKMFRRLYVDAATGGATYNIAVNFYTNQGSSPALQMTLTISDFQKRMDFGLSAKDLSVEFIYSEGNFLKLNGYTLEYRFQRAT